MLYLFTVSRWFLNFMQSGCYIDYIIKKLAELIVRNVFIYSALFFGEKYFVEFVSKKTIDNLVLFVTTNILNRQYNYTVFYNNIIISLIICLLVGEVTYIF